MQIARVTKWFLVALAASFFSMHLMVNAAEEPDKADKKDDKAASAEKKMEKKSDDKGAATSDDLEKLTPHEVVEHITAELLKLVREKSKLLESDPEAYYAEVESVLEKVVSFKFIAKNVMGSYWNKASDSQQEEFIRVFRRSLVKTYAKGMAGYAELEVNVEEPDGKVPSSGKVSVMQTVKVSSGTNRIAYTMARGSSGPWKLINVVLDGVNLGQTFRAQFGQAVAEHDQDIQKAIDNWSA